jgi:glycosyltransferase involved in cell wall biosynthesis
MDVFGPQDNSQSTVEDQARVLGGVRISCIIPTLGRGKILCETIEMLLAQSHAAHEIIIIDQTEDTEASTRDALQRWREIGDIRWLRQREPNASMARNRGALAATGDVLLFLDDDIRVSPSFVSVYRLVFSNPLIVGVAGQILEKDGESTESLPIAAADPEVGWLYFRKNYSIACRTNWMESCNFAIRKSIYIELGGMDENFERGALREESDFAMRYKGAGYVFHFEPDASIYHLSSHGAPTGGSRSWNKEISGWHHCIGDWYFTLCHANRNSLPHLLWYSTRHFVLNRYNLRHPWLVPPFFLRWIVALPFALAKYCRGPKLLTVSGAPAK